MPDVFNNDIFSEVSLTEAILKQPVQHGRLARHFTHKGIRTTQAVIEEKHGKLSLISTAARGTDPEAITSKDRQARSFIVPHLPQNATVLASDIQDVRAFGSEGGQLESVAEVVNERLGDLSANHEETWEHMRAGAIQGVVLDADGSTVIYNYYTEFGVSEVTQNFDFSDANDPILSAMAVDRAVEDALGATRHTGLTVYCGDQWWDQFIKHSAVKNAWDRYQDNSQGRRDQRLPFNLWGINWEEYRTKLGAYYYLPRAEARVVPEGRGFFGWTSAPADTMKAANTIGKKMYVNKEALPGDKGVKLMSQSNPLFYPKRPAANIKLTKTDA